MFEQVGDEGSIFIGVNMKPIPNFDGYFVDELSNVYSMRPEKRSLTPPTKPRLMKPQLDSDGRMNVGLRRGKKKVNKRVHRLALETFSPVRPVGMFACHGANGVSDNSLSNLYWGTATQNSRDRIRDKTMPIGESHPRHKLNELQVRIIRKYLSLDTTRCQRYLAKTFRVSNSTINSIKMRRNWKYLAG